MPPRTLETVNVDEDPDIYENKNVHAIYDVIANHFSSTRYKPWPIITQFLSTLPTGWVGLDSGTGNGKYLPLPVDRPGDIWTIGLDRSLNLLEIARSAGEPSITREVVWGNVLDNGWRPGCFDYAISIATIHHLATQERRQCAAQRLLEVVAPQHGRVLIYVWAVEQDELSKRKVPKDGDPARASTGKDVVVPWVLSSSLASSTSDQLAGEPTVYNRYYHMFSKGELAALVTDAARDLGLHIGPAHEGGQKKLMGVEIVRDGWERSNYYIELRRWVT